MSLVSNSFLILILLCLIVYYIVPGRMQWVVLLVFSYLYYIYGGVQYVFFILFSTAVTYFGASLISRKMEEDKQSSARTILIIALLMNFGMLGVLKYTNFVIENINALLHLNVRMMHFILPLGISFYTFQSTGYLLDVYWKRIEPEKNLAKYALFVSFFPQIMQGPIGRYNTMAPQYSKEHPLDLRQVARGAERVLWGFFKKMLIADWAAIYVEEIFNNYDKYAGLALIGLLLSAAQLYADFSGGIDVVIGVAQMFDIKLDENFQRPFFATSLGDFWHRWHITLGTWMKDYVFYPVTLSKWMSKIGKQSKKLFGKKFGRNIPIAIANFIVFMVVGIWHGAEWKAIGFGFYNGLIIAGSSLLSGVFKTMRQKLNVSTKILWYRLFCIVRTFVIAMFGFYFDVVDNMKQLLLMIAYSFTHFTPSLLFTIPAGRDGVAYSPIAVMTIVLGVIVLFIVSFLQERGMHIRESIEKLPIAVSVLIYLCLFMSLGFLGCTDIARGFIYAQF